MNAERCPTDPFTTMSMPFMEMPQRAAALPSITSKPPQPLAPADCEASPFDEHFTRHHVLGNALAGIAVHHDPRALVHSGAVVADVAVDLDGDGRGRARCNRVLAARIEHTPMQARRYRERAGAGPR